MVAGPERPPRPCTSDSDIRLSTCDLRGLSEARHVSFDRNFFRGKRFSESDVGPPTGRPRSPGAVSVPRALRRKRSRRHLARSGGDGSALLARPRPGDWNRRLGDGARRLCGPEIPSASGSHRGPREPGDEQPPPRGVVDRHPRDHPGRRRRRGVHDACHDRYDPAESGCDRAGQRAPVVLEFQHHVRPERNMAQHDRNVRVAQHNRRAHNQGWGQGETHLAILRCRAFVLPARFPVQDRRDPGAREHVLVPSASARGLPNRVRGVLRAEPLHDDGHAPRREVSARSRGAAMIRIAARVVAVAVVAVVLGAALAVGFTFLPASMAPLGVVAAAPPPLPPRTGVWPVNFTLNGNASRGWGFSAATISNPGPNITVFYVDTVNLTLIGNDLQVSHSWFIDYDNSFTPTDSEANSPPFNGTTEPST